MFATVLPVLAVCWAVAVAVALAVAVRSFSAPVFATVLLVLAVCWDAAVADALPLLLLVPPRSLVASSGRKKMPKTTTRK